jgi:hypothetical protein
VRASLRDRGVRSLVLGPEASLSYGAGGVAWTSLAATTGGDGAFRIQGLEARTYRVEVQALLDGAAPPYVPAEVVAPGTVDFAASVARITVVVRGGGEPLANVPVETMREDGSALSRPTDLDGRVVFLARPGEMLRIRAFAPGYAAQERDVVAETTEAVFDLVPEMRYGSIVVAPFSLQGVALPVSAEFELTPDRGRIVWRKAVVEDGKFVLRDLEPANYKVLATLPGNFAPASGRVTLRSGATAELPLEILAGGRIVLRFLTHGELPEVRIEGGPEYSPDSESPGWTVTGDTMESGLMEPGLYVVHVLASDFPRFFPVTLKPGQTVKLLIPIG